MITIKFHPIQTFLAILLLVAVISIPFLAEPTGKPDWQDELRAYDSLHERQQLEYLGAFDTLKYNQ